MVEKNADTHSLIVELTQVEGRDLRGFVERLIDVDPKGQNFERLLQIEGRIADANAVALWLRENVELELSREDLYDLLEFLSARIDAEEENLHGIVQKLTSLLSPTGTGQTHNVTLLSTDTNVMANHAH